MERVIEVKRPYKHFKGKLYYVHDIVTHSETREKLVSYQCLYPPYEMFVRPLEMFASKVDREKYPEVDQEYRFELYDGE
ncbi:DUF1653 domain-containing protein [uncultured Clostridium sp.]|uniref:DUF1653 domain-containing protein n=1 Tax=uncultured Clostridium sp. TaxID=59620 RepID=UPI0025E4862B|nr:DUF1653 domain-containing protein [uncultured Clostridium sp.]